MRDEDTICHKVTECVDDLNKLISTGSMDIKAIAERLHQIRMDASRMEKALKLRKAMMTVAGIEDEYQRRKSKESSPTGINKLHGRQEYIYQQPEFEFIVKEKGEIVYQHHSRAGVISTVEKMTDIDENGIIDGVTQKFTWGHALSEWYAFDQLKQSIEAKNTTLLAQLVSLMQQGKLKDPTVRKKLMEATRLVNKKSPSKVL